MVGAHQRHHFENASDTEELEMVSVWSLGPFGAAPAAGQPHGEDR